MKAKNYAEQEIEKKKFRKFLIRKVRGCLRIFVNVMKLNKKELWLN